MAHLSCFECSTPIESGERHYTEMTREGQQRTIQYVHGVCSDFRYMLSMQFMDGMPITQGLALHYWHSIVRPSRKAAPMASPEMYARAQASADIIEAKRATLEESV